MTPRERWVVYPLLFFALSLALKPKLLDQVEAKRIRCESLTIAHGDEPGIHMGVNVRHAPNEAPHVVGGSVQVYAERGQLAAMIAAGNDGKAGLIRTYSEGRPRMTLDTGADDTFVELHQTSARPANGIIYGSDARGQLLPLALVNPNIRQAPPEDIRRRLQPKTLPKQANDK
jgi:hypothetical protein